MECADARFSATGDNGWISRERPPFLFTLGRFREGDDDSGEVLDPYVTEDPVFILDVFLGAALFLNDESLPKMLPSLKLTLVLLSGDICPCLI